MKEVKEIQPKGFYMFMGKSNANSCFIEKLVHAKQFLIYANYFLRGYLKIYDYVINQDGWILIVKIGDKAGILDKFNNNQTEPWKVISERMRLFLSAFVRITNKYKGRNGCLVHSSYKRYCFDTLKEAKLFIDNVRNQQIKMYAKKKKYRSLRTHYQIDTNIGKGSIFLCSKDIKSGKKVFKNKSGVFDFVGLTDSVLEKLIKFSNNSNFYQKKSKSYANTPKNKP